MTFSMETLPVGRSGGVALAAPCGIRRSTPGGLDWVGRRVLSAAESASLISETIPMVGRMILPNHLFRRIDLDQRLVRMWQGNPPWSAGSGVCR